MRTFFMTQKTGLSIIVPIIIVLLVVLLNFHQATYAEPKSLPVILLHGHFEDASVWDTWESLLKQDGIIFFTVTFANDDKCGSAASHAIELQKIVQNISQLTGSEKVNIAAHSKGGLDARAYLSKGADDVANLIMIGTPNAGSPLAFLNNFCTPAVWDLRPGASVDEAPRNPHTKYYTISGDWLPFVGGNSYLPGPDDGLVSVSSVESKSYFESLGRSPNNHMGLLGPQEYGMARGTLMGK
jgi:pimeloyl-ACP methyl ester carboxylesterase